MFETANCSVVPEAAPSDAGIAGMGVSFDLVALGMLSIRTRQTRDYNKKLDNLRLPVA